MTQSGINIINNLLNKEHLKTKENEWNILTSKLKQEFKSNQELQKTTNQELIKKQKKFYKTFLDWWGFGQVAECISAGADYLLKGVIDGKTIAIITAPTKKSFSTIEEEEMLKLCQQITRRKKLRKLFSKTVEEITTNLKKFPDFERKLSIHTQKYFWLQNNYLTVKYCDKTYFIKQIKNIIEKNFDPKKATDAINKRCDNIKKEKELNLKTLKIDDKHKKIIKLVSDFTTFQDDRKAISMEAHQHLNDFLKELSKRTGINIKSLYYSTPQEYESILKGAFDEKKLSDRKEKCVLTVSEQKIIISTGKEYDKQFHNIFKKKGSNKISEFEGRRAEGGKIRGIVKIIIDPRKSNKLKTGDILVTTMTSPEFLPLMKKAAAIVTDEGGITCHAAIVARELGKPCVVGTKIATRVLKDGNMIEVNANHGIIKILK
ncbi:MAG: hypothetical protein KKF89_00910 [Nanoarchaeota archaeon]|nr:hypothetical protein [Nanoarchaeota archaeon]MBU1854257.1 hypothetical protein [Nanoarchaeota archaeon]